MRNVRNSWVRVSVDHSSNNPQPVSVGKNGTGPKGRAGSMSVDILARIKGEAVPFLQIAVIGSASGKETIVTVQDRRTGVVLFSERIEQ